MNESNIQPFLSMLKDYNLDPNKIMLSDVKKALISAYEDSYQEYKPHHKQRLFHEAGVTAKERLFLAGNRTGKTIMCIRRGFNAFKGIYTSLDKNKSLIKKYY